MKSLKLEFVFLTREEADSFQTGDCIAAFKLPKELAPLNFDKEPIRNKKCVLFQLEGSANYLQNVLESITVFPKSWPVVPWRDLHITPQGPGLLTNKPIKIPSISFGQKWFNGKGITGKYESFAYHENFHSPLKRKTKIYQVANKRRKKTGIYSLMIDNA